MAPLPAASQQVTVFAAASLTDVMSEISRLYEGRTKIKCRCVYGASSTLAKQILNGAPAKLFISANQRWMDYLQTREAIEPGSRIDLLGNHLVLIAPSASSMEFQPGRGQSLVDLLDGSRLVMGDPDHVPAGMYAKAALRSFGIWTSIAPRLARTADVRGALALVSRSEAAAGIVYFSDVRRSSRVRVVTRFPAGSHPVIRYPAALTGINGKGHASGMLEFMLSGEASAVFERYGFSIPGRE